MQNLNSCMKFLKDFWRVEISVKIRVSFTDLSELDKILYLLNPIVKSCAISPNDKGKYKKAYIEVK